jgi:hypothetical protein
MTRRDFVTTSVGGAMALAPSAGQGAQGGGTPGTVKPQLLELRKVRLRFGPMEARYGEYLKGALIPALNRAGISPVGVFNVTTGADMPCVYLLLPHANADSVVGLAGKMAADEEYKKAAAAFRGLPATDPPYVRRSSSLMVAFDAMPKVEAPTGAAAGPGRIFELRSYESHNETAGLKKIEMFEKGGEIAIFRRVGLQPVFFGRDVIGSALPSLTYMLSYADAAARDKAWATFRDDPEWVKLRSTAGYANADILTNIQSQYLRAGEGSQI